MSENSKSDGSGARLEISIGKEIDKSLAEIVSALLKPSATEVGNLLGDSIGIFSDRVRLKRELNTKRGLSEVREKLEEADVSLSDVTPPTEEELHLLITGLSLADDDMVRNLWAGLFAEALKPHTDTKPERPFVSVLNSLTPQDARILDFLAFTIRTDAEFRASAKTFRPKNITSVTDEEKNLIDKLNSENRALMQKAVEAIKDKANTYGLDDLGGSDWSDNLVRQGIIERVPTPMPRSQSIRVNSFDQRSLINIVDYLDKKIDIAAKVAAENAAPPKRVIGKSGFQPQLPLEIRFTRFGRRLAAACGLLP